MQQIATAIAAIVIAGFACVAWVWAADRAALRLLGSRRAEALRPWLFLGPALVLMTIYLLWPLAGTLWHSLRDATGREPVGLANYRWLAANPKFQEALVNNLMWLVLVPAAATALGLAAARLTEGLRWRTLARTILFLPMAISFAGAGVIWKFIYDYRGADQAQVGLLNALWSAMGGAPVAWLTLPVWNSLLLMAVLVWMQAGFAMVILSAALRSVPPETVEAAILDGASPWQVFFLIELPQIRGTIAVVWTTVTIIVLKVFDIVFVMTNGQWGTQVLANLMYDWLFRGTPELGRGAAIAVVLMALVAPVMAWNIRATWRAGR